MHSLFVTALLASSVPAASPSPLAWQSDYSQARELATQQNKPLAVFVGTGSEGWSQVVLNGSVDSQTLNVLSQEYICVYADRSTVPGAKMASALQVSTGLVISDRTGKVQAFSHDGTMTQSDLQRTVEKFSDANRVVLSTETVPASGIVRTSYSIAPSTNVGTVPSIVLSPNGMYVQQKYDFIPPQMEPKKYDFIPPQMHVPSYPAPVHYQPASYPSSCPNGRCPTPVSYSSCPNGRCPK